MTDKTLDQIQEENRKAIIMANNPEANSYEEALHDELGFNCVVFRKDNCYYEILYEDEGLYWAEQSCAIGSRSDIEDPNQYKIIGKPLTLDRILIALGHNWELQVKQDGSPDKDIYFYIFNSEHLLCWDSAKPNLEQQDEKVQREINKLLTESLIS
jgi:hypothetical protein